MRGHLKGPREWTLSEFCGQVGDKYPCRGGYFLITVVGPLYSDDAGLVRDVTFEPYGFEPDDDRQGDRITDGIAALLLGYLHPQR